MYKYFKDKTADENKNLVLKYPNKLLILVSGSTEYVVTLCFYFVD